MDAHERVLKDAERILETSLADFRSSTVGSLAREFFELRLQATIFQYDICYEFSAQWHAEPQGFAQKVALKNLVHKLYEYDVAVAERITRRILSLAEERGLSVDRDLVRSERRKWRKELAQLRQWSSLRNQASAHYGKDVGEQVTLIARLEHDEVFSVAKAFLAFNNFVCKLLANVGQGRTGA
jgi:hypothetical protein